VRQGKGKKDRYTILSKKALGTLSQYLETYRPTSWLFPGATPGTPITESSIGCVMRAAKKRAVITKKATIHTLRHYSESRIMPSVKIYARQKPAIPEDIPNRYLIYSA